MNKLILQRGLILFALFSVIISCSNDSLDSGLEISPEGNLFLADADTLSVSCYTQKGYTGSALFESSSTDRCPIGDVFDNVFGELKSEVVMEFNGNSSDYYDTTYESANAVSAKLYLNRQLTTGFGELYTSPVYGEKNAFDINVYRLNERYTYEGITSEFVPFNYFKGSTLLPNTTTLHEVEVTTNSEIYPLIDTGFYLVVDLGIDFAEEIMDSNAYKGYENYSAHLNGFYLRPQKKDGDIGALETFLPSNSGILLEYNKNIDGKDSTLYTAISVTNSKAMYTNKREAVGAEIETAYDDIETQHSNLYIQSLGGTRGLIKIDNLDSFKEKNSSSIGINYAELVLPINTDYATDKFSLPKRLTLTLMENLEDPPEYIDDDLISWQYFNGFLDSENKEYRINITEYISQYLNSDDSDFLNKSLYLMVAEFSSSNSSDIEFKLPSRAVLHSGVDTVNGALVRIIYTKLDN